MKSSLLKDVIFLLGLVVAIWLALKILFWALGSVIFLAAILFLLYVFYRLGVMKAFFKKK